MGSVHDYFVFSIKMIIIIKNLEIKKQTKDCVNVGRCCGRWEVCGKFIKTGQQGDELVVSSHVHMSTGPSGCKGNYFQNRLISKV